MAKKLVEVKALKTAVTTVRGTGVRYNIVTNEDADAAAKAEEAGEENTHQFMVEPDIAEQLKAKGVVEILGDKDAEVPPSRQDSLDAQRVAENAEADQEGSSVSGADTRDSTAFATKPVEEVTPTNPAPAESAESATADAPPTGDDDTDDTAAKPAAKRAARKGK